MPAQRPTTRPSATCRLPIGAFSPLRPSNSARLPLDIGAFAKLIRADLIIVDDVGMLPVSTDAAEALFRVVDAAYERRSLAISSNIHPSGFDELMPKSLATATVDRLLHHAHVLITDGTDSYRLAQATSGKGVRPLA
jgi:DNA replication protein DnaC